MNSKHRVFAAGNVYCRFPVMRWYLPETAGLPSRLAPDWIGRVAENLPALRAGAMDFAGYDLLKTADAPMGAATLVEIFALLLQRSVNWPVGYFGSGDPAQGAHPRRALFEARTEASGIQAARLSVALLTRLAGAADRDFARILLEAFEEHRKKTTRITPRTNTMWLAACAERRGIAWSMFPHDTFVRLGRGRYSEIVKGSDTGLTSCVGSQVAKRKDVTRAIMAAAGLPVPKQRVARTVERAVAAAREIGFPVVIKPAQGMQGKAVAIGLTDDDQVRSAFLQAQKISRDAVIESLIPGEPHRLTIIGGRFFAAAKRRPPQVGGDGSSSVGELIARENRHPERQPGGLATMKPIEVDDDMLRLLSDQGLALPDVPEAGRVVLLREVPVAPYGEPSELTDIVHPANREMAERAAALLGIGVCGLDFLTPDVSRPYWENGGAVCEVNTKPALSIHQFVADGQPRDATEAVLDLLYPPGKPSSFPIVAILREPGDTEIEEAVRDACLARGLNVRLLGDSGQGEAEAGPEREAQLLALELDGAADIAIVPVTERLVTRRGLGFDSVDVVIVPPEARTERSGRARHALLSIAARRILFSDDPDLVAQLFEAIEPSSANTSKLRSTIRKRWVPEAAAPLQAAARVRTDDRLFEAVFVGDIGFGEPYFTHRRAAGLEETMADKGYGHAVAGLSGLIAEADAVIGNLEVPLASRAETALRGKKKYLSWSDGGRTVHALRDARFAAVTLANNHSLDCGSAGLLQSLALLSRNGIAAFGAGTSLDVAERPFIRTFTVGGSQRSLVVFGGFERRGRYKDFRWYAGRWSTGVNPLDTERMARMVAELRQALPLPTFVAFPHWGNDYRPVSDRQREAAGHLVAAGMDIVIGHGAHIGQTVEMVSGCPVVFGLGNFVWNTPGRYRRLGAPPFSFVSSLRFSGGPDRHDIRLRLYPIVTDNRFTKFQNRPATTEECGAALDLLFPDGAVRPSLLHDGRGHYVEFDLAPAHGSSGALPARLAGFDSVSEAPAMAAG